MRPGGLLPLGAAMALLSFCLLLQVCGEVRTEVGGRHIRRITASDLPSTNSTEAAKVRLKKLQVKEVENCTKAGSCSSSTTAAPRSSNPEAKTISSFLADDVLQGRLHADVLSHLTTTESPYGRSYESYFDDDNFEGRTAHVPKKTSFSDKHHLATEATHFGVTLTTPRISLFDDFHARMTQGIKQNIEEMEEHAFGESALRYGDNVREEHRTSAVTLRPPLLGETTDKTHEEIALEFSSNFSVVYNDSKSQNSMRRDVVVENGTHLDFERSHVDTKLEPEVNPTIFYISNDTHSTTIPATESVLTIDLKNGSDTFRNNTSVKLTKADALSLDSLDSSEVRNNIERSPISPITAAITNMIHNKTGTPDDNYSTTSEPTRERSTSRSHEPISEVKLTVTTYASTTRAAKSPSNDVDKKHAKEDTVTSSSSGAVVTKDPESNAVAPVSTERNMRASRMFVAKRNSTNGLEQSSQNPLFGSPENSFSSEDATKKPRARYPLQRTGEEPVKSSTASVTMTTQKAVTSTKMPENNTTSAQNDTNPIPGDGLTKEPEESSTAGYVSSSRGRAFTYRRPYTVANITSSDNEAAGDSSDLSTARPSASSTFVNIESVRRRLTTLKRRLQTSTESPVTLTSSNNSTAESNAIVRGWPTVARRPSVTKLFLNKTADKTDNNEGNDILSVKNNVYKPVTKSRGSVRYGNKNNDTSGLRNETSAFPIPPTAVAWTLVTLKGPGNGTRILRQDNSTSDAHIRRWPLTRGKRPWSSEEQELTTVASDVQNIGSVSSPKSTKLSPVTRVRGSLPPKKVQESSMQENRLSTVQVVAPTTEQFGETTEEPKEDGVSTTTPSIQYTTETDDLTTTSEAIPITSTTPDVSTISSGSEMELGDVIYKSTFISESQVTTDMTPTSTDDTATVSTESLDSTTASTETTSEEVENTTTEGSLLGRLSSEEDISLSTSAGDEDTITTTTESLFQSITTTTPYVRVGTQSELLEEEIYHQPQRGENDQQRHEGESGNHVETYQGGVGNAGEANNQGDENKQGGSNTDEKQQEVDVNRGDDTRADGKSSEVANNQGDSGSSSEEEENINTDAKRPVEDNQSSGTLPPVSGGGDEPHPAQEEAPDYGGPESAALDHTSSGATTAGHIDVSSPEPEPDESQTSTTSSAEVEPFATPRGEQTTTWISSTSAIEWASDSTTLPSISDVPFYLILSISATWPEFCDNLTQFKQSVVNLMETNARPIKMCQVVLPDADRTRCQSGAAVRISARSSVIEVEMYLVDDTSYFDHQLTSDFYSFWRNSGLPDSPFEVNDVKPAGQTSDEGSDDGIGGGGMIAAITISCIGAVCLLLLAVLWLVMRKRQQRFNYGQRCTPVSLDAYSLDSVSVCGSVRRKGGFRNSKRSYGNAGFDDPASPTHPMGFAGLANFVLNRESLEEEFASIPQVTANVDELPEGADTKNRYANVIPLPETRVQLSPREAEPLSDYINANFVHGPKNASKYYIACQAPLTSTVNDFWRMIWEQQSKVILMLTDLVENGVEKSADYLPPSEVLDCHRLFGDFQITMKKREVKEMYIISTLHLKNLETNSWREVMHLWYVSWPTQGVPEDVSSVIAFLLEARPYMRGGPCVVHCSPGTGRTGAVIACDLCIRDFETTRIVDIPRCVARLRRDRAGAVQTRDQYVFIYKVINLYGTKLTGGALDSM